MAEETLSDVTSPGVTSSWSTVSGGPYARSAVADYVILEGDDVVVTRFTASCLIDSTLQWDVTATNPAGTIFRGGVFFSGSSCGSNCSFWGPHDSFSSMLSFGDPLQLVPAGETRTFSAPMADAGGGSFVAHYSPNHGLWDFITADSRLITHSSASATLEAFSDLGVPTDFTINRFEVMVHAVSEVTVEYELTQSALGGSCSSPPSSTGAPATLASYGSQQEGTELLTIRANGLPASSYAVLFVGTAAASQPLGSYNLCVGGQIRRQGGVQPTGLDGQSDFEIVLETEAAGDTVFLQAIFRDQAVGIAATNGASFVVKPR